VQEIIDQDGSRHGVREPKDPLQLRVIVAVQAHLWTPSDVAVSDGDRRALSGAVCALVAARRALHVPVYRVMLECERLVRVALSTVPHLPHDEQREQALMETVSLRCIELYYGRERAD
jgi:hypothetical protein